jgi:hypothetical protein
MKLIFEETTKTLVHIAYDSEKKEAFEVIMDDALSYIKALNSMQSEIIPQIYPEIFSRHFYPEQRGRAVQAALLACKMNSKQASLMQEVRG